MTVSTLSHQLLFRAGSTSNGCTTVERSSVDFLIDGESLLSALVKVDGGHSDFMGCFVEGFPDQNQRASEKLMLKAKLDTERGGVLLYICPECGDIGCGAYSACITRTDSGYTWEDFAYENGYEKPRTVEGIGPFHFSHDAYESALYQASVL
jgi:hypothetical protein